MKSAGLLIVALLAVACEREPAIVVRFDAVDQGTVVRRDLATASPTADAAIKPAADLAVSAAPVMKAKAEACASDADCVLVPDGCCGCANGGKLKAAHKHDQARLEAAQKKTCADTMCTMMVSTDPSCGQRPSCVSGECRLRAARPEEMKKLPPREQVQ
jgi:hypothetical protein